MVDHRMGRRREHWRRELLRRSWPDLLVGGDLDLAPPSAMRVTLGHYVFPNPPTSYPPLKVWTPLFSTNLSNGPAFEWSWIPDEVGQYEVQTARQYDGSNFISQTLNVTVRPSNDAFAFSEIIHPSTASTNLACQTDWSSVEANEPDSWTNPPQRSLWWKWTPDHDASVRFKAVADGFWGLPVDIFTGSTLTNLIPIAGNDSRTLIYPLEGLVPLQAQTGTTYFIRVCDPRPDGSQRNPTNYFSTISSVRTNLMLVMEPSDAPLPGLIALSTATGTPNEHGSITWTAWAKVFQEDGLNLATNSFNILAQFFIGKSPGDLHAFGIPSAIHSYGPPELDGTASQGLASYPGIHAGDAMSVQLRVWDGSLGGTYELARANGASFGRSEILTIIAGSESEGPSLLTGIRDVILQHGLAGFTPGSLSPAVSDGLDPLWRLTGPAGFLYSIESSDLGGGWQPLLLVTNSTGTLFFSDPRPSKPSATFYRSRIID
jgi:hypothetical protein